MVLHTRPPPPGGHVSGISRVRLESYVTGMSRGRLRNSSGTDQVHLEYKSDMGMSHEQLGYGSSMSQVQVGHGSCMRRFICNGETAQFPVPVKSHNSVNLPAKCR